MAQNIPRRAASLLSKCTVGRSPFKPKIPAGGGRFGAGGSQIPGLLRLFGDGLESSLGWRCQKLLGQGLPGVGFWGDFA